MRIIYPYSASDTLLVQVRQAASLDYSGAQLPVKVIQGNVFTELLKEAELDSPFEEICLKTVCEAADQWLKEYDLTGIK